MSYSIAQAQDERTKEISLAIFTRDSEAVYRLARIVKDEGDDQLAHLLLTEAKKIDQEDSQEDEERAQKSEREVEYAESYNLAE